MQKWEYKVWKGYEYSAEKELNKIGQEGWEMVGICAVDYKGDLHGELSPFDFEAERIIAYFKRPLP